MYVCILYLMQSTFGVKKVRPSKVESYLEEQIGDNKI